MLDFVLMFPSLVYLVIFSSYLHVVGLHERANFSNREMNSRYMKSDACASARFIMVRHYAVVWFNRNLSAWWNFTASNFHLVVVTALS